MTEGCVVSSSTAWIPPMKSNDAVTLSPTAKTFVSEDLRIQNHTVTRFVRIRTYLFC